jgi:hypothetical protein
VIKGVTYLAEPGVLNALWYLWFGIARICHWVCGGSDGGSYDGSNECRATRKVMSVCIVATFLLYVALLLSILLPLEQ